MSIHMILVAKNYNHDEGIFTATRGCCEKCVDFNLKRSQLT